MANTNLDIDRAAHGRVFRVIVSRLLLGSASLGVAIAARFFAIGTEGTSREVSPVLVMVGFFGYLIVGAILMATIAARLYSQHKVRELKFDLANIILITTLIALPFGASNAFIETFQPPHDTGPNEYKAQGILMFTTAAAILLLPVFFLTEALLI